MLPLPRLTPLLDAAPAWTRSVLAPMFSRIFLIADADPLPISAIMMSDATPMMIPIVVRTERRTFRRSERIAIEAVRAKNRMWFERPERGRRMRIGQASGSKSGPRLADIFGRGRAIPSRPSASASSTASSTTTPSRMRTIRFACSATEGSCVTRMIVIPSSALSCWKSRRISSPVFESRLPVGSSAIRIEQSLTRARAMATRCCSPPESRDGSWSSRSPSPMRSRSIRARSRHSWSERFREA